MARSKEERIHITLWPDQPLPVPPVYAYPAQLEKGDTVDFLLFRRWEPAASSSQRRFLGELVSLPDELYLRELWDLDLSDEAGILAFARSYGPLGGGWKALDLRDDLPAELVVAHLLQARDWDFPEVLVGCEEEGFFYQPVPHFILHAQALRDAVRLWLFIQRQLGWSDLVSKWEQPLPPPACLGDEEDRLAAILNTGLSAFHVRMQVETCAGPYVPGETRPGLYAALCLQFFNHIVKGSRYHRCANEACGRLFYRQRGTGRTGARWSTEGVKYCSSRCAKAQAQREYRRRRRQS